MKNKAALDERIIVQSRKINSEAFSILLYVLILSVIVQQFLLKAPFEQYACEFFCFFGASIYILCRKLLIGLNVFEGKNPNKLMITNAIVTAFTVMLVSGILNYNSLRLKMETDFNSVILTLSVSFVTALASSFAVLLLLQRLNNKRQKQIQKELDADEQEN